MEYEDKEKIEEAINNICIAPISDTHIEFSVKVAEKALGIKKIDLKKKFEPGKFSGGEYHPRFILDENKKTLKGKTVYIIMTPSPYKEPEALMYRAFMTARAAKENNADKTILISTEFPHARQDRGVAEDKKALGEPNTVKLHAELSKTAGIDEIITIHEHSPRISAYFAQAYGLIPENTPFDANNPEIQEAGRKIFKTISPHAILADYLLHHSSLTETEYLKNGGEKIVLKAVDTGNATFIEKLHQALFLENSSIVYCEKARTVKNDPDHVEIKIKSTTKKFKTLEGVLEIYADDGLDTGGTMIKSVKESERGNISQKKAYGTPADRIIYFTHAWLAGRGYENIQKRLIDEINAKEFLTTNTRPYIGDRQHYKFKTKSTVLRLAFLIGDAILSNELGQDITTKYENFETEEEQHTLLTGLYVLKRHERHFMHRTTKTQEIPEIMRR